MATPDVVVVGAGTAGCAVAARLVAQGRRVLLLEAGPDYGPRSAGRWPRDLLMPNVIPASHDVGYASVGPSGQTIPQARAIVAGGCSAHNHCVVVWGSQGAWDRWRRPTAGSWDAASMAPYLDRAATTLRTRPFAGREIMPLGRAFLAALDEPDAPDVGADGGFCRPGVSAYGFNVDGGERFNAAFAYLDPIRSSPLLTIEPNASVRRLDVSGANAAVRYRRGGAERIVGAAAIVLCAGAYDTPALLMRSGIGDVAVLSAAGIDAVVERPAVGAALLDHPLTALWFEASDRLVAENARSPSPAWMPPWQTVLKARSSRCGDLEFDLHLTPADLVVDGRQLVTVTISCVESRADGHVRIGEPDGAPVIDHAYLGDEGDHDSAVLRDGMRIARELFAASPLRELIGAPQAPGFLGEDDMADDWLRSHIAHYAHPAGSVRMSIDPDRDGVDPDGRLYGLDNVFVEDASVMPVLPNANTNLPTAAIAERIADGIASSSSSR